MSGTDRAVQALGAGKLPLDALPLTTPPAGHVRIRVEACGVCHTDAFTIEGGIPGLTYPRVPGHEVIGRIDLLGPGVDGWQVGQRVGVGFLGGHCGTCPPCRRGDFAYCQRQGLSGAHSDGGYAEVMIARASGLALIPESLKSADAAPLLCAGLTTFKALRRSRARPGELVAIQGVGGLGHLGIQFANRMGLRVAALARGSEKADLARQLGAHIYIDTTSQDAGAELQKLGGARVILATAANSKSQSALIAGLAPGGELIIAGAGGEEPISISGTSLIFGERTVTGTLTGTSMESEDTLGFSALLGVRPMIETLPLAQAEQAYRRMLGNEARFRMVLVTGQ